MPKQDVAVELYYDGAWHDLVTNDDVLADAPIVIKRGQGDESAALRPTQVSLRLANDDDMYRTSNPQSPLYGKAGRATPLRVSVGDSVRAHVEVTSMQPDQSRDFRRTPRRGKAWVDIEAAGLLQRIGQWSGTVQSPMTRYFLSTTGQVGLWPLEDGRSSRTLSQVGLPRWSPIASRLNAKAALYSGAISMQSDDGPPGGDSCLTMSGSTGKIWGYFTATDDTGSQMVFHVKLASTPATATYESLFTWRLTKGGYLYWEINNSNYRVRVVDNGGTELYSSATAWNVVEVTDWVRHRVKLTESGGTTTIAWAWYAADANVIYGITSTYASVGEEEPWYWVIVAGNHNDGAAYSHVYATTDTDLSLTTDDAARSFNGFRLERTAGRWFRLLSTEYGLPYHYLGDFNEASQMGAQRPDTLPNLLREIGTTEDGLIYDDIDELAAVLRLRNSRYNQTPALELSPEDLPALPREVVDDQGVHNIVTAQQRDGEQVTVEDDTGPLGTQDPPDGVGEYRHTVDVNIAYPELDLDQYANWWLRRGTVDLPRFPQVTVDLGAKPELVDAVNAVEIGDVITIAGFREYTIRLHVLGWTETIGTHSRKIVFNCAPDQQFDVGTYDDTNRRYDLRSCVMNGAVSATATSLTFTITDDEAWSTTSTPYDLMISGERVTVTSMSARSGSFSYAQTATVRRSINGICKALPDGAEVHIATPGRWAL